ncbi:MAG: VgrG-related protein [Roseivirga sp.]
MLELKCGGKTVAADLVNSVRIKKCVNQISNCEVTLLDGQQAKKDFPLCESDQFLPGKEIEVKAGYNSNSETVFKGIITTMGLEVARESGPALVLKCKDKAVSMTVGCKNAFFYDKSDKEIISTVIGKYSGLSAKVEATSGKLPEVVQYYATDWDFVLSRADRNGMVVTTGAEKIEVVSAEKVKDAGLEVTYGVDILSFSANMDALSQYKKVKASAWSMKDQKIISGGAPLPGYDQGNVSGSKLADVSGLKEYELQSTAPLTNASLEDWARAQSTKSAYARIRGTLSFQGTELVAPAKLITIKGLGDRFNGKAFISAVEHDFSNGNWISTVEIGLDPNWFTEKITTQAPPASGLLPGIQGLQIGKIKKIEEDPEGEFRVQVDLPIASPAAQGIWARYASFYASKESGAFFYPQVGDEVVLGFFNEDPRYPVVLGSLYSSARKSPYKPDKDNSIQAIVTKNKLKLEFDDKEKILTLITPGEHKVILNDQDKNIKVSTKSKNELTLDDNAEKVMISDQHNNSIEMSSSGITIHSNKKLVLKAKEAIETDTGGALDFKT